MFDEEEAECPLCMEPLDETDKGFFPCACGYQICGFCWHKLRNEGNGLCPACRTPFEDRPAEFAHVDADSARAKEKQRKAHERKPRDNDHRKNLANVRVVQPNLVYVIGLSPRLADESVIRKNDYFGQYGKIMKVVVNKGSLYNGSHGPSASAYITYQRKEDAQDVIRAVDGLMVDNRVVRASFGTTKYCSYFLKHVACPNPDCMYLHEVGETVDSFTKDEMKGFPQRSDYDHSRSPSPTRVATPVQNGTAVKRVVSTKPKNPNASALPANASWAKKPAVGAHASHPGSLPSPALSSMKEIPHTNEDFATPPHGNSVRKSNTQWPGANKDATWNQGDAAASTTNTPVTTQQPSTVHMGKKSPRLQKNAKQMAALSPPASGTAHTPTSPQQAAEDRIPDNWDERDGDHQHGPPGTTAGAGSEATPSAPDVKVVDAKATSKAANNASRKAAAKSRTPSPAAAIASPTAAKKEVPNTASTTSVASAHSPETRDKTKGDKEKHSPSVVAKKKPETAPSPANPDRTPSSGPSDEHTTADGVETGETDEARKQPLTGSASVSAPPGLFSVEHAALKQTYTALPGISDNNSSMFSHSGVGPMIGPGPPGLVRMPGGAEAENEPSEPNTASNHPGEIGSAPGSSSATSIGGGGSRFAFGNRDEDEGGEFASSFFSSMSLSDPKKGTSAFGLPPRGLGAPPGLGGLRDEVSPGVESFGSLTDFGLDQDITRPKNSSSIPGPVLSSGDLGEGKFSSANWDDDKRMTPSGLGADALRFPSGLGDRSSIGSGVSAPPGLALGGVSELSGLGNTTPDSGGQAQGTGNARQWQDNLRSLFPGVNISFSVGNPEQNAQQTPRGGLSSDPNDHQQPLEIGAPHLRGQSMWDNGFDGPSPSSLPNSQHSINSSTWGMSDSPYSSLLHNNRGELHQSFLSAQDAHFDVRGTSGTTSSLPPPPPSSSRGFDPPRQGHPQHIQQRQPQNSFANRPTQPGSISQQHSQSQQQQQQQQQPPPPPGLQHSIPSRQIQNNDEQISRMYDHSYTPGGLNSNSHRSNTNVGFNNSGSFPQPPPGVSMMQDSQGLNMHPPFGRQENRDMFHRPGGGLHLQQQQSQQQQHHQQPPPPPQQQQQLSSKLGDYGINGAKSGDGWPIDNLSNSGGIWNENNDPQQMHNNNRRQQPQQQHRPPPGFGQPPPPPPQLSGRQQRGNPFDNNGNNGPLGLSMPPGPPGLHQRQQQQQQQQQQQHHHQQQQHLYDGRAKPMGAGVWGADPAGLNQPYGGDVNDSRFAPQRQSQQAFGMPWGGSYFPSDQSNNQTGIGANGGWPASDDHRNDFDLRGGVRDGASPVLPPPGFENVSPGYMSGIDKLIDE